MKGCLKAIIVVAGVLFLLALPQIYVQFKIYQVRRADPNRILAACREIISNRSSFPTHQDKWTSLLYQDVVRLLPPIPENIPQPIRKLHPKCILIREDNVLIDFSVLGARGAILGFKSGANQYGTFQFVDGLWFWNGNKSGERPTP